MNKKGFTLIELLIVIAIVGIVAAIAIPNLLMALQRAKQKATCGTMKNIGSAIDNYISNVEFSPKCGAGQLGGAGNLETILEPFYIKIMPVRDGWNNPMYYERSDDPSGATREAYSVLSYGRNSTPDAYNIANNNYICDQRVHFNNDIYYSEGAFTYGPKLF